MKKLWLKIGMLVFWCSWPALWIYLRNSKRTRLLLVCDDEFLVLRGWISSGAWSLPGGGLHKGEDPLKGLAREVKEETGLELTRERVTLLYVGTYSDYGFSFTYDCYVAELPVKPIIRLRRGEIVDHTWQSIKNPNVKLGQDSREALAQWLSKG